ncbi:hypothetical protein LTR08_002934 [Meristemomyces frigidus]|nr:hypothetical protein LTR08_002934 [Meristemomyces frigidus]
MPPYNRVAERREMGALDLDDLQEPLEELENSYVPPPPLTAVQYIAAHTTSMATATLAAGSGLDSPIETQAHKEVPRHRYHQRHGHKVSE